MSQSKSNGSAIDPKSHRLEEKQQITTLSFRAPEVILRKSLLSESIDLWALGVHGAVLATGLSRLISRDGPKDERSRD